MKSVSKEKLTEILETIASPELAEEYDSERIGFVLDMMPDEAEIKKIAVCLDVTEKVLTDAAKFKADVLICHHNPIFHPTSKIGFELSKKLKIAFDNNISIYCMHTNFDKAESGTNDALSRIVGLKDVELLKIGAVGYVEKQSLDSFAKHVSNKLKTTLVYVGENPVEKVAVCGGSCFNKDFLKIAKSLNVDTIISSELKHSDVLRERENMNLIDAGHYPTENPGMESLKKQITEFQILDEENILFIHDDIDLKAVQFVG